MAPSRSEIYLNPLDGAVGAFVVRREANTVLVATYVDDLTCQRLRYIARSYRSATPASPPKSLDFADIGPH